MPELLCATTSRKGVQDIVLTCFVRGSQVVLILRRHHFQHALLTHDAQAKEQYEPNASDITHRSLLMSALAQIFALYGSVRLPDQPSGSSGRLPRDPTILWYLV